jgi:hypothetical protein
MARAALLVTFDEQVDPQLARTALEDLCGGRCACCGERVTAVAPAGLEPGSPFGNASELSGRSGRFSRLLRALQGHSVYRRCEGATDQRDRHEALFIHR